MRNRIAFYRYIDRITCEDLARDVGVSTEEQKKIESGEIEPSVKLIKKYVRALRAPAGQLFPPLDYSKPFEYENHEEELKAAERIFLGMRFSLFLKNQDGENTRDFREIIAAFDTAIKLVRKERRGKTLEEGEQDDHRL